MSNLGLLKLFLLVGITSNIACTKNTLNIPEAAQSIEGSYALQDDKTAFPIQGQTVKLNIKRVATDSVEVVIQALTNGQSKDSLVAKKALVIQGQSRTGRGKACIEYEVHFTSKQEFEGLRMTCQEENVFYFYTGSVRAKFKRI